jgi:glucose-6-phosphate 1-epimerase
MSPTARSNFPIEVPATARLTEQNGMPILEIIGPTGGAAIHLQGAHLTHWQPTGAEPVLFVSGKSHFAPGKAIRGGVPVCFPWFANRAGHPESPAHGFVRASDWKVASVTSNPDESVTVHFEFTDSEFTRGLWPHPFRVDYRITAGAKLEMSFEVENTGSQPFSYEAALHTYFRVSDASKVEITGLEGTEYIDKVDNSSRKRLDPAPLRFTGETDRVFVNTTTTTRLVDPRLNRTIVVEKSGSSTTVVWNPWIAKAKAMADFGDDEWPCMACIETANSGENSITLQPGQKHTMVARIWIE